jgi:DNA-binding NtrC family response regulator
MLERALMGARAVGDLHNEAFALLNLAAIFQRTGALVNALDGYRAALARFARLGNRTEVRRAAWNLANVYTTIGHYEAAQSYLDQARRLAEQDDSERGRALVATTEGDLALTQGQAAAALAAFERARDIFLRMGEGASRVHESVAKAAWAAVLLGDIEQARRRAADLPPSQPGTLAHVRGLALEGALLATGATDDGGADEVARGLSLMVAAVDELERLHASDDAWRTLSFLAERYEAKNDKSSAAAARARARQIVERIGADLPADLRAIYDADPQRAALFGRKPVAVVERRLTERAEVHARRPEWDARYGELAGRSSALLRVFDRLDRIAKTKTATVLVRGESGTGKELVAAAVHRLGDRANGPFVRVNCAALVETLLMSELFGHEKGSFTGALARKIGRFELARGGTIFLDEIGDISPKTQVSLLRVLQERQFERVGGTQTISTDAAVICATHRDLETMVKEGTFREDLYYRLRGVVVEMPALRERVEDIPLLALRFLQKAREELGRAPVALSPAAEELLMRYRWPGNIRELQNVVRSVALFCEGDVVDVEHLSEIPELFSAQGVAPPRAPPPASAVPVPAVPAPAAPPPVARVADAAPVLPSAAPTVPEAPPPASRTAAYPAPFGDTDGLALGDLKRRLEFEAISNAMRQTGGNITRAAALLKMKRPRLSQIVNGNPELKAIKEASRGEDGDEA